MGQGVVVLPHEGGIVEIDVPPTTSGDEAASVGATSSKGEVCVTVGDVVIKRLPVVVGVVAGRE